jgi:hypothetical protein
MFLPNFKSIGLDSFFSFLNSLGVIASKDFLRALDFLTLIEVFEFIYTVLSPKSNLGRLIKLSEFLRSSLESFSNSCVFLDLLCVIPNF